MARQLLDPLKLPPVLALVIMLGLFVISNVSLLRLNINNSLEVYLPEESPSITFNRQLRETFPQDDVLALLFEGDSLFSDEFVRGLEQVATQVEQLPRVDRVFTLGSLDHITGTEDGFVVEPLLGTEQLESLSEEERRARVLGDRFAPGLIAARDGRAVALVIRPESLDDSLKALSLMQATEDLVSEYGLEDELSAVAGQVALDVAQLRAMLRDSMTFVPATTVIGLLLIWWLFRRGLAVSLAAVTIGVVVSMSVAVVALWEKPYTLVTSMIPPLMAALTTALMIHLYNGMAHASRRGFHGPARVARALEEISKPALFTALTTSAGLLSLALSPIQPIATFGVAAASGVMFLFLVVIGLLPAILARWDKKPWPVARGSVAWLDYWVGWSARLAIRHAGWVIVLVVGGLAVGIPYALKVQAETDLYAFFDDQHPLTISTKKIQEKLAGVSTLEVVFDANQRDALKDPDRLLAIREFQFWLDDLPEVDRTLSMVEIIEEMHWAFHGEDSAFRQVPDNAALISQYLFIYDGRELYELVDQEFEQTRLTLNLNMTGAKATQALIETIRGHLESNPVADMDWEIAGFGRLFADQEKLLVKGQVRSLAGALGLIFLLILLLWRSLLSAVLCMLPNAAPIILIFISMGVFGIWLDMATAMIASVAVGVAVDDTIHVYHGYKWRVQAGFSPVLALMRTYRQAGRAVSATTIVLCAQLVMLAGSDFVPTAEFGLLTAVGLLAALLFDLMLLPAILILLHRFSLIRGKLATR